MNRLHTVSHNSKELKTVTDSRAKIWSAHVMHVIYFIIKQKHWKMETESLLCFYIYVFSFSTRQLETNKILAHEKKQMNNVFLHVRDIFSTRDMSVC